MGDWSFVRHLVTSQKYFLPCGVARIAKMCGGKQFPIVVSLMLGSYLAYSSESWFL